MKMKKTVEIQPIKTTEPDKQISLININMQNGTKFPKSKM